jgi:hypothetical protein
MHIKSTLIHNFTPTRKATIRKTDIISASEDMEKTEPSYIAGGNIK